MSTMCQGVYFTTLITIIAKITRPRAFAPYGAFIIAQITRPRAFATIIAKITIAKEHSHTVPPFGMQVYHVSNG